MKPLRMLLVRTRDPGRHRTLSHVDIARIRPGIRAIGERTDIIIPPGIIRQEANLPAELVGVPQLQNTFRALDGEIRLIAGCS